MPKEERGSCEQRAETRPVALPRGLRLFWAGSALVFGLTFAVGTLEFRAGYPETHYNPLGGPWFDDLLEYVGTFRLLHTEAFFHNPVTSSVAYPPFGAVLYRLVYLGGHPSVVYMAAAAAWLAAGVWGVRRELLRRRLGRTTALLFPLTLLVMSFPIAGLLQRGNLELFVWMFAGAGMWAYVRGRDGTAAGLWGLAAAAKLYPAILLVLLLPRQKLRVFLLGIGTFVGVSLLSMLYLGPSVAVAWRWSVRNVFGYQGMRAAELSLHELAANHSMFGLVKLGALLSGGSVSASGAKLMLPYYGCAGVLFVLVFFRRLWKMPVANQVLAVSVFMVMLPPISYFYTLVHLYAPAVMLVFLALEVQGSKTEIPRLTGIMLLMVPLFGSFMLFTFRQVFLFGGLVQAMCLLVLFVCALRFPLEVPVGTCVE